jgi:hypothetical protein
MMLEGDVTRGHFAGEALMHGLNARMTPNGGSSQKAALRGARLSVRLEESVITQGE